MARSTLFLLLALLCLVYACQAGPLPQEAETQLSEIGEKIKGAFNTVSKSFEEGVGKIMEDPKVKEFMESTKNFFEGAKESVQGEAKKLSEKLN